MNETKIEVDKDFIILLAKKVTLATKVIPEILKDIIILKNKVAAMELKKETSHWNYSELEQLNEINTILNKLLSKFL